MPQWRWLTPFRVQDYYRLSFSVVFVPLWLVKILGILLERVNSST